MEGLKTRQQQEVVLNTSTFPETLSFIKSCCGCKAVLKPWTKCNLGIDVCLSFHRAGNNSPERREPPLNRVFSCLPSILNTSFLYSACSSRQARSAPCIQPTHSSDKARIYFGKETFPFFPLQLRDSKFQESCWSYLPRQTPVQQLESHSRSGWRATTRLFCL